MIATPDRPRVFVELKGGLGNQLFQIAAGCSLVGREAVRVVGSRSGGHLSVADLAPALHQQASKRELWRLGRPFTSPTGWRRVVTRLLRGVRRRVEIRALRQGTDVADAFQPRSLCENPLLLGGYFQHPAWFSDGLSEVVDALLAAAPSGWAIDPGDTVVVVARGGDYRDLGWMLDADYYGRALDALGTCLTARVVSDDPALLVQLTEQVEERGITCLENGRAISAVSDFWTIAAARSVVMSNSSFCWWATVVGDAAARRAGVDRTVVFPRGWVTGCGDVLYMPGWIAQ